MNFVKCEKCQLNYIPENETYCSVCKDEAGILDDDLDEDDVLFCSSCNLEKPIHAKGLCKSCYKKMLKSDDFDDTSYEYDDQEIDTESLDDEEEELPEEIEELEDVDNEESVSLEFEKENEENTNFDDEEEW